MPLHVTSWNYGNHVTLWNFNAFITLDVCARMQIPYASDFLRFRLRLEHFYCCRVLLQTCSLIEMTENGNCIIVNVNDTLFLSSLSLGTTLLVVALICYGQYNMQHMLPTVFNGTDSWTGRKMGSNINVHAVSLIGVKCFVRGYCAIMSPSKALQRHFSQLVHYGFWSFL